MVMSCALQSFGSLSPEMWCQHEQVEEVQVRGEGFTDNLVLNSASCTFRMGSQEYGECTTSEL